YHCIARLSGDFAGNQVAHNDALGMTIDYHQVEHFGAREHLDRAETDLPAERLVSAEEQLLSGLAARIKGARHLRPAERAIGEQPAIFARKRHALRNALVDDIDAYLRQTIDVGFARAKITTFDGVI